MMECVLGVQVSEATTRRLSEQAGALALAFQTAQTQAKPEALAPSTNTARLAVSADGAYVPHSGRRASRGKSQFCTEGWNLTFRCLEKLLPIRILFTEFVICVLIESLTNRWNIAFSLVGCLFVRR